MVLFNYINNNKSNMVTNTKNSTNYLNIQKELLENKIVWLDDENSKKVLKILELPDEMIKEWVNISYKDLLKKNSPKNINKFRKLADPEKLKNELTDKVIENIDEEDEKSKKISEFIENSENKFILSQKEIHGLSYEQLDKKLFEIWIFQNKYKNSSEVERKKIREQHNLPKIEDFPESVQKAIDSKLSENNSIFNSEWAENHNEWKLNSDVYKLTKWRHDNDYFSMIQLMKFMMSLEKDFIDENKKLENSWSKASIRNANEWLIFYTDEKWNYKRLIKQSFAPGESVDVAMKKEFYNAQWEFLKRDPENNCIWSDSKCKYKKLINPDDKLDDILPVDFNSYLEETQSPLFKAYKDFLQSIQNISDEKWYLLDISDSRQGWATRRWNVLNTSNVFVKEYSDWTFEFSVIDPDVFNKDWESKFEWKEQENAILEKLIDSKKVLSSLDTFKAKLTGILTEVTNFARDWNENNNSNKSWIKNTISKVAVAPKQEMYMNNILENKEYNLEVDEELKNNLIFWTNFSRLAFRRYKEVNWKIVALSDDEIVDNEIKYNDSMQNLEDIWKPVKILDFYPKNKKEEESWFAGIFAEVNWEKYFIPKWTKKEKKHKKDKMWIIIWYKKEDLKADMDLAFRNIPIEQTKSMIDFFETLDLQKGEKINILWNSLGWALWQIMMKMYPDRFSKWIFPHSPWAGDLNISETKISNLEAKYISKFRQYFKTKEVDSDLLYIDWENPFRPISWLWTKLKSKNNTKQYSVAWWTLHFMPQLIKFMKNLEIWSVVKVKENYK